MFEEEKEGETQTHRVTDVLVEAGHLLAVKDQLPSRYFVSCNGKIRKDIKF